MNNRGLLRTGIIGTVIAALCCFTPILVILLGTVGLSAMLGLLDYVLFPQWNPIVPLVLFTFPSSVIK